MDKVTITFLACNCTSDDEGDEDDANDDGADSKQKSFFM